MVDPFYFGEAPRLLCGLLHAASRRERALLICPPLLHDATRSRRGLWSLAETQAAAGSDVLRFDWYGSGDSTGESGEITLGGLLDDLGAARSQLRTLSNGARLRMLGLRSASLPLLAFATQQAGPVDLVLWDVDLCGRTLVARWREQHREQLRQAGRYPYGSGAPVADELLGFPVSLTFLAELEQLEFSARPLPVGSRVLVAGWELTPKVERFIATQRAASVSADWMPLPPGEIPSLDPAVFERQRFPRRSVAALDARLSEVSA